MAATMGLLRFVLAYSVVASHAGLGAWFGNSRLAVQIFFMISGFLISFVLNKKATYAKVELFYLNRALRIFPIYWGVAIATLFFYAGTARSFAAFYELNGAAKLLLFGSNTLLFGQDAVMFLQQRGSALALAYDFRTTNPPLWYFLLVPQAWSLSLELTFYLLAPFTTGRPRFLVLLALLSFGLWLISRHYGLSHDPWNYRFFPSALWLFLAGMMSERFLLRFAKQGRFASWAPWLACAAFLAYDWIGAGETIGTLTVVTLMGFLLPWLFTFQHGRKWDVFIGDLSYPIYICHWLVLETIGGGTSRQIEGFVAHPILALAATLPTAWALERFVARPVERVRQVVRRSIAPVDLLEGDEARPSSASAAASAGSIRGDRVGGSH